MSPPQRPPHPPAFYVPSQHDTFWRRTRIRQLDLASLFTLLLLATGLNYMWISIAPYWLVTTLAVLALLFMPSRVKMTTQVLRRAFWTIVLPWCAYVLVIVVRDAWAGTLASSFSDRAGLNLAALVLFLTCAALAYHCNWRHVLIAVGILGLGFGLIAIGQFARVDFLWYMPDTLSAYSTNAISLEGSNTAEDIAAGFLGVGRARGLDMFVHKFASYQGIIAGIIGAMALFFWCLPRRDVKFLLMVTACALLSTLGVMLTFSRAPLLGVICAMVVTLWLTRVQGKLSALIMLLLFCGALVVSGNLIGLMEATQFSRLFEVGTGIDNDASRVETWLYSVQMFFDNPLFGGGTAAMSGTDLPTHSVPLRILGDFGLIGFVFYAWVWLSLLRAARRALHLRNAEGPLIGTVVIAALIVAAFDNLTHSSGMFQRDVSQPALLGLCYGLAISAGRYGTARMPL